MGRPEWSGIARGASHRHDNPERDRMHTLERQAEQLRLADVRLAPGTLYEALSRLEGQGLIESVQSDDRRRPYRPGGNTGAPVPVVACVSVTGCGLLRSLSEASARMAESVCPNDHLRSRRSTGDALGQAGRSI